jgi:hypothetical protein
MDDVERMYHHLVRTIRASFPQYLSQPFEVGELYQTILPYRLHRRELGLETNQDYELALMELLSGAHGYLVADDKMHDVLSEECRSPNPNTAKIRDFASTKVALAAQAAALPSVPESDEGTIANEATGHIARPVMIVEGGEDCSYCKGALPAGRKVSFCPYCGQDLTIVQCPACGSELEREWKFCVTCGRGTTGV